jgi:HD-like signal output (HDOD) protein
LFVDDEPKVLEGLKRMLYSLRSEWQMEFVSSAPAALERMAQTEFDVLVTDIRMPEMSGIELLTEVVERYPQVIRLVLSGTVELDLTLRSAALAHQYLVKPCDAATLRGKVDHALNLRVMLGDPALKRLISRLPSLPSAPAIYLKLLEALRSPDVSVKEIGTIIEQDIGMTAKILQLVNSAFFGITRRIVTPADAVAYLGVDAVRAFTLSASIFAQFHPKDLPGFRLEELQDHSLKVGALAGEIGTTLNWSKSAMNDTFVGGLLHDTGKLVLAHNCPDQFRDALTRAQNNHEPLREAERSVFGTSHAEVGGYLLWLWGVPDEVTEVAAMHHSPAGLSGHVPGPVLAVHVADALLNGRFDEDVDLDRLRAAGWLGHVDKWKARSEQLRAERRTDQPC